MSWKMPDEKIKTIRFLDDKLKLSINSFTILKTRLTMKKLLFLALLMLPMIVFSQTQMAMNAQAAKDYAKVDKELNVVYQQIKKKYAKDSLFMDYMKAAQLRWIDFRDAEFKRYMPHFMTGNTYYGSMYPLERNSFMTEMTTERVKTMKKILKEGPR